MKSCLRKYIFHASLRKCDSLLFENQDYVIKLSKKKSKIQCNVFIPDLLTSRLMCSMLHWSAIIILHQMQTRRRYGLICMEIWSNKHLIILPKYGWKAVSGDELHTQLIRHLSCGSFGHTWCISLCRRSSGRDLCIACSVDVKVVKSNRNPISYLN